MYKITIALAFTLLVSSKSFATPDASVIWNLSGFTFNGLTGQSLILDLEVGINAVAAHGFVTYTNGSSVPTTGSCFFTTENALFCSLSIEFVTGNLSVDLNSLNGDGTLIDQNGEIIVSGTLNFNSFQ